MSRNRSASESAPLTVVDSQHKRHGGTAVTNNRTLSLANHIVGEGRALATLAEVATGLTLAPAKIRNDVRRGLARPTRLGRRVAFSREQIADYLTALEADAVRAA